jgi:hypothetical protein
MKPVSVGRLLAVLRRVGREFNLKFEYKKPAQLGRHISNDLEVIRDAGFDIDRQRNAHTKNFEYRIGRKSIHKEIAPNQAMTNRNSAMTNCDETNLGATTP